MDLSPKSIEKSLAVHHVGGRDRSITLTMPTAFLKKIALFYMLLTKVTLMI